MPLIMLSQRQHLAHTWPAARAFLAYHDDVAGMNSSADARHR